jgi:hypothetical protein
MRRKWIYIAPAAIMGIVLFTFVGGELVKQLWNWLLPPLFGWRQLTFWQALGLLALCRILFGGFGSHRSYRSNMRGRMADRLADRMGDRWDAMGSEERERFRQRVRARCGFDPAVTPPATDVSEQ